MRLFGLSHLDDSIRSVRDDLIESLDDLGWRQRSRPRLDLLMNCNVPLLLSLRLRVLRALLDLLAALVMRRL